MRFNDSETQKLLRDTARALFRDKYPWERLYALERGDAQLTEADLRQFAHMGWLGLLAPAAAGGGGLPLLEAAVVIDECGYAAVPAPIAVSNIAADLLAAGDTAIVQEHLTALVTGRRLYTISEATRRRGGASRGSTPPALSASSGKFNGVLPLVPFAAMADFVLTPLLIDEEPTFALVPLEGARREPVKLLDRGGSCDAHFQDVAASGLLVLARGAQADALHERCDALATAFSLIEMAGMMQRVLEMTGEYISNRVQFGQPIAKFQAARHHAADLLMQAETTRWTAYHALWSFQRDGRHSREIWLAKHWAIRAAQSAFEITHLLHGGIGVGLEYPLHLYTQGLAALVLRCGTMSEMVTRTLDSLDLGLAPAAR